MGKDVIIEAPTAHLFMKALKPITPQTITVNMNTLTIIDENGNEISYSEERLREILERIMGVNYGG